MMKQFFLLTVLLFSSQLVSAFWPFGTTKITVPTSTTIEVKGAANNIKAYCYWKYIRSNNKKVNLERLFEVMSNFDTKY